MVLIAFKTGYLYNLDSGMSSINYTLLAKEKPTYLKH